MAPLALLCGGACVGQVSAASVGLETGQLVVGGRTRTYAYHVPTGGAAQKPLVVAFHGRLGTGAAQEKLTHLSKVADAHDFIVVFPDGIDHSWADARGVNPANKEGVDDLAFARALIDAQVKTGRVDAKRVFATGMSNGAELTYSVACELADVVTAVAPVAGLMPVNLVGKCAPSRPIPIIIFHGTEDPFIPYAGGLVRKGSGGEVESATDSFKEWAKIDGCTGEPEPLAGLTLRAIEDGTRVDAQTYTHCAGGATVTLVTVVHGGHTWPGGHQYLGERMIGKTTGLLDAGEWMWLVWNR
jgi:polyhydroxybutyrate depolymerase